MNEFEFRKRCIINPDDPDPAFQAALENADFRRIQEECFGFDEKLAVALNVPAPEGLQDRIIEANKRPSFIARWKARLAAFASLIATLILGFTLLLRPQLALSDMVFEHIYHDMEAMHSRDIIREEAVDKVMHQFGSDLDEKKIGIVRFINDCEFMDKTKGIHLVYDGANGPVTVFYLPHGELDRMKAIAKNEFQGILFPHHEGAMANVGLIGEDLNNHRNRIESAIHWQQETASKTSAL